jgi:hypothetical protein
MKISTYYTHYIYIGEVAATLRGPRILDHVARYTEGRAIDQAVSRRLPTAAARIQTRVWSCGIL